MFLAKVPAGVAVTVKEAIAPLSTTRAIGATAKKKSAATRTSKEKVTFLVIATLASMLKVVADTPEMATLKSATKGLLIFEIQFFRYAILRSPVEASFVGIVNVKVPAVIVCEPKV